MSLASVLGMKEPPKPKLEDDWKKPSLNPFDFVNAIQQTGQDLIVDEWSEKQYNPYIINRALSMGADTALAANEMNSRGDIPKKAQNAFLLAFVRKRKRYNKWLKSEQEEALEIVKKYYRFSDSKARIALGILSESDIEYIKGRMDEGGQ